MEELHDLILILQSLPLRRYVINSFRPRNAHGFYNVVVSLKILKNLLRVAMNSCNIRSCIFKTSYILLPEYVLAKYLQSSDDNLRRRQDVDLFISSQGSENTSIIQLSTDNDPESYVILHIQWKQGTGINAYNCVSKWSEKELYNSLNHISGPLIIQISP